MWSNVTLSFRHFFFHDRYRGRWSSSAARPSFSWWSSLGMVSSACGSSAGDGSRGGFVGVSSMVRVGMDGLAKIGLSSD